MGTHAKEVTGVHHLKAAEKIENDNGVVEAVHLSAADIGVLGESRSKTDGKELACVYPGPSPPPPPSPKMPSKVESSDSGLTDGEIAGVAIGAAIGGIVLLGIVALILRSLIVKMPSPCSPASR